MGACYAYLVSGRRYVCRVGRLVVAAAAPCVGTGRWGVAGREEPGAHRPQGESTYAAAPASQKKASNPNFGSRLA